MTIQDYIIEYRDANRDISRKLKEIERLKEMVTGTTSRISQDKVQASTENKTERIVAQIVDLEAEIDRLEDKQHEIRCKAMVDGYVIKEDWD